MNIYYAITPYHTLNCILHKIHNHSDEESVIYLSNINFYATELAEKLNSSGLFDYVVIFDDSQCIRQSIVSTVDESIANINEFINKHLTHSFKEADEIFIGGDHFPIGLYCINNQIKYHFFEDGAGIYTNSHLLFESVKSSNEKLYNVIVQLQANGGNRYVKKRYINFSAQIDLKYADNEVNNIFDFNVSELLAKLDKESINRIKKVFDGAAVNSIVKKSAIVFTQHFANLNIMTLDQQESLYSNIVDYFVPEDHSIVIKRHPSDVQGRYIQIFDGAIVLSGYFPAELIPYCLEGTYDIGISVTSTAILNLNEIINRKYVFSKKTEQEFISIHRYYAAAKALSSLGLTNTTIQTIGVDESLLSNFIDLVGLQVIRIQSYPTLSNLEVLVIDKLENNTKMLNTSKQVAEFLLKLEDHQVVVFINSEENHIFYEFGYENIFKDLFHLKLRKLLNDDPISHEVENLFVYTKDKSLMEKLIDLKIDKKMKYSKMNITNEIPSYSSIEKKKTRAILASTINRLKLYSENTDYSDLELEINNLSSQKLEMILQSTEKRLISYIHHSETRRANEDYCNNTSKI